MEIIVTEEKERIDKYLQKHTEYSRSLIQKMIESKYILINNLPIKANYMIKENDVITIKDGFIKETSVEAENIKLDIIYEDNDLIIINKPSGMVVHPGNGNSNNTLVNALMYHTNLSDSEDETRPGIVHRIDKDTSGIMMAAKNNKTHELLTEMFKNKEIKREYLALVIGEIKPDTGKIDAPIGRDPKDRKKMTVIDKNAKEAITHFQVLTKYSGYTLLKLNLETGRTHQIRVHLKYIGYPVFNDPVYTNNKCTEFGQFLHSSKIHFIHPISKKTMEFTCPLPKEFNDFLKDLELLN